MVDLAECFSGGAVDLVECFGGDELPSIDLVECFGGKKSKRRKTSECQHKKVEMNYIPGKPIEGKGKKSIVLIDGGADGGGECAFHLGDIKVCSRPDLQKKMCNLLYAITKKKIPDHIELVVEKLMKHLKCKSESELLSHEVFIKEVGIQRIEVEKQERFKPSGPKDNTWFNNENIDKVLDQWAKTYDGFYNFPFHMIDFKERRKILWTKNIKELYESGIRKFACVINTDTYSGRGKHWMALFGCMEGNPWTVEFFNSSGNKPQPEVVEWLFKVKNEMEQIENHSPVEILKNTGVVHQQSETECGPYSMYYIYRRLNGDNPRNLMNNIIKDETVYEFRKELFRDFD